MGLGLRSVPFNPTGNAQPTTTRVPARPARKPRVKHSPEYEFFWWYAAASLFTYGEIR
jgi:hypothetical protein